MLPPLPVPRLRDTLERLLDSARPVLDADEYERTAALVAVAAAAGGEGEQLQKALVERARRYGTDPRHGWNEVARDYLEYLIHGPFIRAPKGGTHCRPLVADPDDCRFDTTDTGIVLAE